MFSKSKFSLLCMILAFYTVHSIGSQSRSSNLPQTESELLAELDSPSFDNLPFEVQFKIFETLLNITEDKKIDDAVAKFSRISHKFYDIAHSNKGQKIINERRSRDKLQSIQDTIKSVIWPFNIDIVENGVNAQNDAGDTALMAIAGSKKGYESLLRAANDLIFYGADVNTQNNYGATALMSAAWRRNDGLGLVLLKSGAKPNLQDDKGKTALMYYIESFDDMTYTSPFFNELVSDSDLYLQDNESNIALDLALKVKNKEEEMNYMTRNGKPMVTKIENEMKKDKKRFARYMMENTLTID